MLHLSRENKWVVCANRCATVDFCCDSGKQVVKNLVFLAEVVSLMECEDGESVKQKVGKEVDRMSATLMISRVLRVGRIEAGYAPHQTAKVYVYMY